MPAGRKEDIVADLAAENYLLQRKNDLLQQLIAVMNTTTRLDNILRYVLDLICMVTTAEAAVIMTKEVIEGDDLTVKAVANLDKKLVGKSWPICKGLIGEAYCTGKPKITAKPASDAGFTPEISSFLGISVNNVMVFPLNSEGRMVGSLEVINKKDGLSFGQDDAALAEILVEQTAQLVGQATALKSSEAKIQRFNTLLTVSKEITQLDNLHSLLEKIMNSAKKVMRADASSLFLIDDKTNEMYIESAQGEVGEIISQIRMPIGKGIAGWVAQKGVAQLVPDAYEDARFNPDFDRKTGYRTKSVVCVPLEFKAKTTGVIQIINALDKETFDEEDMAYLTALAGQAAVAIENVRLMMANKELFLNVVMALVKMIDSRHKFFAGHSTRVATYASLTARMMGLTGDTVERIQICGFLHDIGRLQIPESILVKPGPLGPQELAVIRMQPVFGAKIVQGIKQLDYAVPALMFQMEQFNGKGYPKSLSGDQIPLFARIIGLCSAFDAMCSERPYRKAMDPASARGKVASLSGGQFDPAVAKAFLAAFDKGLIKR
jgi:HD-GYP domain-containing protein (c-di-GMP phosphodiesterase class II)